MFGRTQSLGGSHGSHRVLPRGVPRPGKKEVWYGPGRIRITVSTRPSTQSGPSWRFWNRCSRRRWRFAFFTTWTCPWSINLSDPHGGESNPCYYSIRPNRLFVLMSALRIASTRSAWTAGCRGRRLLWTDSGSGVTCSSPGLLYLSCPRGTMSTMSTSGVEGGPCAPPNRNGR